MLPPPSPPPQSAVPPTFSVPGVHGAYVGDGRVLIGTTWHGKLLASSQDLGLMPDLLLHGLYDEPFTSLLLRELEAGDVVFDVGAHIGTFTVLMGRQVGPAGRVIAYEAAPDNVALLRDNVALNYLGEWVEVVPKAAAATAGTATLTTQRRFQGSGSLRPPGTAPRFLDVDTSERVEVATEPLDIHLGAHERIALVKIDVEGAEWDVLQGMSGLLASGAVRRISLEILRAQMGATWQPFTAWLREQVAAGWRLSLIAPGGALEAVSLERVLEVGWFPHVVMDAP
jgi:FkbM family methyltransferase